MKYLYTFFFALGAMLLHANDTLTCARVYNMQVGDTFDYFSRGTNYGHYYGSVYRQVVTNRHYSANNDTLFVELTKVYPLPYQVILITLPHVNEFQIYNDTAGLPMCTDAHQFGDTGYNGRVWNQINQQCFEGAGIYKYADGLGLVKQDSYYHEGEGHSELIAYTKGDEHWGTPLFNTDTLRHYTPIPEECAVWTNEIRTGFPNEADGSLYITEQIRTGGHMGANGHTYVELYYRYYNHFTNTYRGDSLIGYFRNDTANQRMLAYHSLHDTAAFLVYDFNASCAAPNCLTQVLVGNQWRTKWPGYIEGVGGSGGFIPVQNYTFNLGGINNYITNWGTLTCFSVCGQTLYPTTAGTNCEQLTALTELPAGSVGIYPNPAHQTLTVTIPADIYNAHLSIIKTIGQVVSTYQLTGGANTLQIPNSTGPGMYYWVIQNGNQHYQAGKLVIE